EAGADAPQSAVAIGILEQRLAVRPLGEPLPVEGGEAAQALADGERGVRQALRLAGDAEFELGRAITAAADEDRSGLAAGEGPRRMGVGGDVLGAAARTAVDPHRTLLGGLWACAESGPRSRVQVS